MCHKVMGVLRELERHRGLLCLRAERKQIEEHCVKEKMVLIATSSMDVMRQCDARLHLSANGQEMLLNKSLVRSHHDENLGEIRESLISAQRSRRQLKRSKSEPTGPVDPQASTPMAPQLLSVVDEFTTAERDVAPQDHERVNGTGGPGVGLSAAEADRSPGGRPRPSLGHAKKSLMSKLKAGLSTPPTPADGWAPPTIAQEMSKGLVEYEGVVGVRDLKEGAKVFHAKRGTNITKMP